MIKLVTDSTCDLSSELLAQYDISVVPLYVNFNEESYLDGVNIKVNEMYDMVKEKGMLPKTAAASPGAFYEVFEPFVKENIPIIYLGIGSKFSGTLNSALNAKNMLESDLIHLIDSENLSSGSGLLLLKAGEAIKAGKNVEEVVALIQTLIPKVRSQFVIDTLDYLHKGGRINGLQNLMGSMLKLKPIIKVVDGEMAVGKKARGTLKNGVKLLIKDLLEKKDLVDDEFLMITHSMSSDMASYINQEVRENIEFKHIYETSAGCVISSHCGKGTIGILYIMK
ncbi:MAG: DegV family protein [Candidatus Izemoplasmataceae bacterium]